MKKIFVGMILVGALASVGYIPVSAADSENLYKIFTDDGELVTIKSEDQRPGIEKDFGKGGKIKFLRMGKVQITFRGKVREGMVFVCEENHAPYYVHYDDFTEPGRKWCPKPKYEIPLSNKK